MTMLSKNYGEIWIISAEPSKEVSYLKSDDDDDDDDDGYEYP
jgi:hypothetical protein